MLILSKDELNCMVIRTLDFEPGSKVPVSGLLLIYLCNWERFSIALCEATPSGHILLLFRHSRLKLLKLTNLRSQEKVIFLWEECWASFMSVFWDVCSVVKLACESWSGNGYEEGSFAFFCVLFIWVICGR